MFGFNLFSLEETKKIRFQCCTKVQAIAFRYSMNIVAKKEKTAHKKEKDLWKSGSLSYIL